MALNIRNNHTIELLCKMGPSTSEYSGWIHIKRNKVHIHSISVELRSGMVLHKQLMEGMTHALHSLLPQNTEVDQNIL